MENGRNRHLVIRQKCPLSHECPFRFGADVVGFGAFCQWKRKKDKSGVFHAAGTESGRCLLAALSDYNSEMRGITEPDRFGDALLQTGRSQGKEEGN